MRSARTGCNNPADGSKFFGPGADADDPRAPSRHVAQRHFQLPRTSADSVPGNAVPAPVDKHAPARRPDTSLALVAGTTPAPWLGIRDCSNTSAHNRAEKNIHNPPAGTGEDAVGRADLEIPFRMTYCEEGPREVLLPTGQVSDGSSLLPPEAILCFLPDSDLVSLPTSLYLNSSLATRHPSRPIAIRAAHIHDHQPPVISLNHPDQTGRILLATDMLPGEPKPICPTASTSPWIRTPNPPIGTMRWPSFCCISFGRGHGPWTRQAAIKTTTDRGSDLACDGLPSFAALSPCLSDRHTGKYSEPHGC